jgi:hypothetical protein
LQLVEPGDKSCRSRILFLLNWQVIFFINDDLLSSSPSISSASSTVGVLLAMSMVKLLVLQECLCAFSLLDAVSL